MLRYGKTTDIYRYYWRPNNNHNIGGREYTLHMINIFLDCVDILMKI